MFTPRPRTHLYLHVDGELPKKLSSKRENSVPGQYINTGDLPTHSVIRELHFDSSSDNIDNCVNRRHVSHSAPGSRSEPSVRIIMLC